VTKRTKRQTMLEQMKDSSQNDSLFLPGPLLNLALTPRNTLHSYVSVEQAISGWTLTSESFENEAVCQQLSVISAEAEIQKLEPPNWIPAFTDMT
jgi:hypothetical protein